MEITVIDYHDKNYFTIIKDNELERLKNNFEKMEVVKKYPAYSSPGGGFEYGYRALLIAKKNEKFARVILYSLYDKKIIVRERDIFSGSTEKGMNITVYKCKIPQEAIDILSKHESELPKGGFYLSTFPTGKGVL